MPGKAYERQRKDSRSMSFSAPVLIVPECHARGCHHDGDHFIMVKCGSCGHWFCPEHLESREGRRDVSLVDSGLRGLSYYLGRCADCQRRHPHEDAWLR
jgi:hypothetical protein